MVLYFAKVFIRMGKNMAAKSNDRVIVTAQLMFLVERLRRIQGYKVVREYADGRGGAILELSHGINLLSWGEDIKIDIYPCSEQQTVVEIVSECAMPTQIIDWGRNSTNIKEIMTYLLNGLVVQR